MITEIIEGWTLSAKLDRFMGNLSARNRYSDQMLHCPNDE